MYISETELENFLKRDLTTKESATFATIEASARSVVDNYCDTNWDSTTVSSSRYYDGGKREILIDPCHSITAIVYVDDDFVTDEVWDADDYITEPVNETIKTSLRMRAGRISRGMANVKVTAKFTSYIDEVPAGVKAACLHLCSGIINNPGGLKSESIEGYSYTLADQLQSDQKLQSFLAPYRQVFL